MIHLPSVVAVASACRSLREDLGAIAPWKHIFFDLKADEIESEESEGERRKIRYDEVDPKDLKPKRGKGLIDWHWVLAKYAVGIYLCGSEYGFSQWKFSNSLASSLSGMHNAFQESQRNVHRVQRSDPFSRRP
jgi:hypothetical protein